MRFFSIFCLSISLMLVQTSLLATPRVVTGGLRRRPPRTPERHHSPRPEADQHACDRDRRQRAGQDHRFRYR